MKYLSNDRINDGSWWGTNKGFLDHWHDTCHDCKEYTSFTHPDDTLKLEMLKNAVKGAPHLASVEANSDLYQQMSHSMMPMDFNGYFEVLSSAAENYDDKVGSTMRANTCCASMHSTSYAPSTTIQTYSTMWTQTWIISWQMLIIWSLRTTRMVLISQMMLGAGFHSHHTKHGKASRLRIVS
jgi:hypothetical protein